MIVLEGRKKLGIYLLLSFFAALTLLILKNELLAKRQWEALPNYGPVPTFDLTDHNNQSVTQKLFSGKTAVSGFIFTRCPSVCPLIIQNMKSIAQKLKQPQFILFTADPAHDTPEQLYDFAQKKGLAPARFSLVTGPWDRINAVSTGFQLSGLEEPMSHSARLILTDRLGNIRGFYHSDDSDSLKKLQRDISLLNKFYE